MIMRTMSNNLKLNNTKVINTLRGKYPNTELFMVLFSCIWNAYGDLRSKYLRSDLRYDFSPNTGNYGPEITPYLDTFHGVIHT